MSRHIPPNVQSAASIEGHSDYDDDDVDDVDDVDADVEDAR